MSITKELLNQITGSAERRLREAGIRSAAVEVEMILEYLLETDRINILLYGPDLVDEKTFATEREILYKFLFDMKGDLNNLKKLVHEIIDKGADSTGS